MTDMPHEDPRDRQDPDEDPKHQHPDPNLTDDVDDPDAPAPYTGPQS